MIVRRKGEFICKVPEDFWGVFSGGYGGSELGGSCGSDESAVGGLLRAGLLAGQEFRVRCPPEPSRPTGADLLRLVTHAET